MKLTKFANNDTWINGENDGGKYLYYEDNGVTMRTNDYPEGYPDEYITTLLHLAVVADINVYDFVITTDITDLSINELCGKYKKKNRNIILEIIDILEGDLYNHPTPYDGAVYLIDLMRKVEKLKKVTKAEKLIPSNVHNIR